MSNGVLILLQVVAATRGTADLSGRLWVDNLPILLKCVKIKDTTLEMKQLNIDYAQAFAPTVFPGKYFI